MLESDKSKSMVAGAKDLIQMTDEDYEIFGNNVRIVLKETIDCLRTQSIKKLQNAYSMYIGKAKGKHVMITERINIPKRNLIILGFVFC